MPVEVVVDPGVAPAVIDADRALEALAETLAAGGNDTASLAGEVCVRLVDEATSRSLNNDFRQRDKPTNVLSFPADVALPAVTLLGDLAICVPVVRREAAAQGKAFDAHLTHLFLHGVLHLLGYDHETDEEAHAMEALECAALAALGIADPYVIPASGAPCQAG